jgi:acetyl-CoA synthetase
MGPVGEPSSAFCWTPTAEQRDRANVSRLMRRCGLDALAGLRARSVEDPSWFWPAVVEDLGIEFFRRWARVVDTSGGPEWSRWFTGGLVNVAHNCVHRHARGNRAAQPAIIWEGEDGSVRSLSYADLGDAVSRLAGALDALGARREDRVGLYLPMLPEAIVTFFACATLGLVTVPIFSGFGADAVASRLEDSGARILVTADGFLRRGRAHRMKGIADAAASAAGVDKWFHGDWACRDADGHWYVLGRSDDTLNVAGKRLGPAEVESVLAAHEASPSRRPWGSPIRSRGRRSGATAWCTAVPPPARCCARN